MKELSRFLIFFVLAGAIFAFHQWYFGSSSSKLPPSVAQEQQEQFAEEISDQLVALRGTFTALDGDRFSWEAETRIETADGVAVNRIPRTGRLVPDVIILRPGRSSDPTDVAELSPGDIAPGEPVIVFVTQDQLEVETPNIWQIIVAR